MTASIQSMTVAELDALVGGDDDDLAQEAMDELGRRFSMKRCESDELERLRAYHDGIGPSGESQ